MTDALVLDSLTAPLTRDEVRRYRLAAGGRSRRSFWARIGGFLGALVVIVLMALYITEGELEYVPWIAAAVAAIFVLTWVVTRRDSARRWRLRSRLARFAEANGLVLEVDVPVEPVPPPAGASAASPSEGSVTGIPLRLRGCDAAGAWEAGLCACVERSATGRTTSTIERVYFIDETATEPPAEPTPAAPTPAGAPFRRHVVGSRMAFVFVDDLDLVSPDTWMRFARIRSHVDDAA